MGDVRHQPGNPTLTAELQGLPLSVLSAACDKLRERVGLPDYVLEHILDDTAAIYERAKSSSCQWWWGYRLRCPHGDAYWSPHPLQEAS